MMDTKMRNVVLSVTKMLVEMGLDIHDPHMVDTPSRVARMYLNEFFKNVHKEFDEYTMMPNTEHVNEIICSDKIEEVSTCSHHLLPFSFLAWMMYVPDSRIVGASKLARCVGHYARRPQTQERLCHDVIENFMTKVRPLGAMVVMRGHHGCIQCRGVRQRRSGFTTSAVRGIFKEHHHLEMKGYELIKISLLHKE